MGKGLGIQRFYLWSRNRKSNREYALGIAVLSISLFLGYALMAHAHDIADKFSIGGVLAGAYQYQSIDNASGADDAGRGGFSFQAEISFSPTERDEIFAGFGSGAGNGLSEISPFSLAPWGAALEDDVKDINGRSRDYLLTAWYKHAFQFSDTHTLSVTGGLIDATGYLDENAYANDEYTQFMNAAFVNGPNVFAPSYDIGGAFEWEIGKVTLKGVAMNVGENGDGNNFNFFGLQLGYTLKAGLGEGNYRLVYHGSSKDFLDPTGNQKESLRAVCLSFDQELGNIIGAWIRLGTQDDAAAVDHKELYSGGIDISGKFWGREQDNIGVGYGYLQGGNTGIDRTQATEAYVRFGLNEHVAATLDVQYMDDTYDPGAGTDVNGWIFGARMSVVF